MNDPPLSHAKGDLHFTFLDDLPLTSAAAEFARRRHVAQHRDSDGAPFIVHPLEVAFELHRSGYPDHVIAAAVLHDVLEDTDTDQPELQLRFGPEVCELVALVSDDPAIADEEERKDDIRDRSVRATATRSSSTPPTKSAKSESCVGSRPADCPSATPTQVTPLREVTTHA